MAKIKGPIDLQNLISANDYLRTENARLREAVENATARLVCAYMMDEAELRESVAEEYDTLEAALKEPGDGRRKNHG